MKPVEFEGQSVILGPPARTPRGECGALPILRVQAGPFGAYMISYWKPSPEDLAALNAGAHVRLAIHGTAHPPVWIDVEKCAEWP